MAKLREKEERLHVNKRNMASASLFPLGSSRRWLQRVYMKKNKYDVKNLQRRFRHLKKNNGLRDAPEISYFKTSI